MKQNIFFLFLISLFIQNNIDGSMLSKRIIKSLYLQQFKQRIQTITSYTKKLNSLPNNIDDTVNDKSEYDKLYRAISNDIEKILEKIDNLEKEVVKKEDLNKLTEK
ncbi:MAG: hypothetical protein ACXWL2_04095 [Candidatus Chromulinivorax sp.]